MTTSAVERDLRVNCIPRPSLGDRRVIQCAKCHLVQFDEADQCKRCKVSFLPPPPEPEPVVEEAPIRSSSGLHLDVGGAVKLCREALEVSQLELSDRMGLPRTYLSKVENRKLIPTISQIERLAGALNLPVWFFVSLCGWRYEGY